MLCVNDFPPTAGSGDEQLLLFLSLFCVFLGDFVVSWLLFALGNVRVGGFVPWQHPQGMVDHEQSFGGVNQHHRWDCSCPGVMLILIFRRNKGSSHL